MDSLHFRKFWDYLASLPNSLRTQERHCCNSKCHQQTHNISITWKLRNAESQVPPQNYWSRSCNWTKSPGDSHKQWDLRITVRVESGFPRRTEPVGCVCVCVCVCVYKWRERERFILKLWLLWPWGLETLKSAGQVGRLEISVRTDVGILSWRQSWDRILSFLKGLNLFSLGLQLMGWGPPTLWRKICFMPSLQVPVLVTYKEYLLGLPWHSSD